MDITEMMTQREELDAKINAERVRLRAEALSTVRQLCAEHGIAADEIEPKRKPRAAGAIVPPKYRDPATGATWTGRGKPPKWIEGRDRESLLIPAQEPQSAEA